MAESRVKVGVRIRPLLPKEQGQNSTFNSYDGESVSFKGQTYTYDHVFGMELSQSQLYGQTAEPMLKSFLEGYNCTIMAYGQTGSGKTYSMGTSDITYQDPENQGLISRFVADLFENLNSSRAEGQLSYTLKASYLEIYGEEVYDLLDHGSSSSPNRIQLPVREDEAGKIVVQGLNELVVKDADAALDILSSGARHRITASTAMNAGSSRSHAVFTLQLDQHICAISNAPTGPADAAAGSADDVQQTLCSKLTFVDLAGSERIKRTGAEGQRLKEGIQINSGLFNLGQVINSLADEQKLKNGQAKSNHVPYRNSKLTHLLKDALGGNSQTLFLACVSPAESNESETQSTLQYAKQARNIQNKPVQNVDKIQREIQRLRMAVKVWTTKAVTSIFGTAAATAAATTTAASPTKDGEVSQQEAAVTAAAETAAVVTAESEADLMRRPEVAQFIASVNASISEKVVGVAPTPLKGRLSMGALLSPGGGIGAGARGAGTGGAGGGLLGAHRRSAICSPLRGASNYHHHHRARGLIQSPPSNFPGLHGSYMTAAGEGGAGLFPTYPTVATAGAGASSADGEPDETGEELINQILEIHNREKEKMAADRKEVVTISIPSEAGTGAAAGVDALSPSEATAATAVTVLPSEVQQMDESIREKEELLMKLKSTVEGFAIMRNDYNTLLGAINSLEEEKSNLETELAKAKKESHATGTTTSKDHLDALLKRKNDRIQKVDQELKQMREEKKMKDNIFNQMKRDAKKCQMLEKDLEKLKVSRVTLAKQQKTQSMQINKLKKDQALRNVMFKKSDVKKQQQMNQLKSELATKTRILEHKIKECNALKTKFEACQQYIRTEAKVGRLTATGSRTAGGGASAAAGAHKSRGKEHASAHGGHAAGDGPPSMSSLEAEQLRSSKTILQHMLLDRLDRHISKVLYDQRAAHLLELNDDMEQDAADLDELMAEKKALLADLRSRGLLSERETSSANAESTTVSGADCAEQQQGEQEEGDEEVDLGQLCGPESNGLSEEEKYQISQLKTSIDMCESNLERLTKEVDVCNADIDELSLKLEDHQQTSQRQTQQNPDSEWYTTGKKIVTKLSQAQCHSLVWDLMEEKLQTLEQLRITHSALSRSQSDQDQQQERTQELQDWVTALREELKTRLERAEKQRVNDVWALVQASNSGGGNSPHSQQQQQSAPQSAEEAAAMAAKEEAASRIAVLRAMELDRELRNCINREEGLEADLRSKDQLVRDLQRKVSELSLRAAFGEGEVGALGTGGGDDEDGDGMVWKDVGRSSMEGNESRRSSAGKKVPTAAGRGGGGGGGGADSYMDKLFVIWAELGLSEDERSETLEHVQRARELAKERVVLDAEAQLQGAHKEVQLTTTRLQTLCAALGCPVSKYVSSQQLPVVGATASSATVGAAGSEVVLNDVSPLLPLLSSLHYGCRTAESDLRNLFPSLVSVKDRLTEAMSEMWLEITDLPPSLRALAKLCIDDSTAQDIAREVEESEVAIAEGDVPAEDTGSYRLAKQLTHLTVSMQTVTAWEADIRKLNRARVQTTSKLISLRDACVNLTTELQMGDLKTQLTALVHASLTAAAAAAAVGVDADGQSQQQQQPQLSNQAVAMAVQILCAKSASNPPGSEKLLSAMEQVKLVLESVKANRTSVAQQLGRYADIYFTRFPDQVGHALLVSTAAAASGDSSSTSPNTAAGASKKVVVAAQQQQHGSEEEAALPVVMQFIAEAVKGMMWDSPRIEQLFQLCTTQIVEFTPQLHEQLQGQLKEVVGEVDSQYRHPQQQSQQLSQSQEELLHVPAVEGLIVSYLRSMRDAPTPEVVRCMGDVVTELEGMGIFVEEEWLRQSMQALTHSWSAATRSHHMRLCSIVQENDALYGELLRLQGIVDAQREVLKADAALGAAVLESQEFEKQSAENRGKKLKGGGSTLLEEEKFRKNSKAKFSKLSERINAHYQKLNSLTTHSGGSTGAIIDVRPDLSGLSTQGRDLVKGRFKDKVDLMHLQLSTSTTAATAPPVPTTTTSAATIATTATTTGAKAVNMAALGASVAAATAAANQPHVLPPAAPTATRKHNSSTSRSSGGVGSKESKDVLTAASTSSSSISSSSRRGGGVVAPTSSRPQQQQLHQQLHLQHPPTPQNVFDFAAKESFGTDRAGSDGSEGGGASLADVFGSESAGEEASSVEQQQQEQQQQPGITTGTGTGTGTGKENQSFAETNSMMSNKRSAGGSGAGSNNQQQQKPSSTSQSHSSRRAGNTTTTST